MIDLHATAQVTFPFGVFSENAFSFKLRTLLFDRPLLNGEVALTKFILFGLNDWANANAVRVSQIYYFRDS